MRQRELEKELRLLCPHGAKEFITKSVEEMKLHSTKNFQYASRADPYGNFDRVAAWCRMHPGLDPGDPVVVALIDAHKQIDACFHIKAAKIDASESFQSRAADVSVYYKLAALMEDR